MGMRVKRKNGGYMNVMMAIECKEFSVENSDIGEHSPKCIAKSVKKKCVGCSLYNAQLNEKTMDFYHFQKNTFLNYTQKFKIKNKDELLVLYEKWSRSKNFEKRDKEYISWMVEDEYLRKWKKIKNHLF